MAWLRTRTFWAFSIAPAIPVFGLIAYIIVAQIVGDSQDLHLRRLVNQAAVISLFGLPIAYGIAMVFGLPAFIILRSLGILNFYVTLLAASAIGSLFTILSELRRVISVASGSGGTSFYGSYQCDIIVDGVRTACGYVYLFQDLLTSMLLGALAGLTFWVIYNGGKSVRQ
ncbi:MAG: hypothetical protein AAF495_28900 [Pseudomonadota bacterium]